MLSRRGVIAVTWASSAISSFSTLGLGDQLIAVRFSTLACHVIPDSSAAFGFGMTRFGKAGGGTHSVLGLGIHHLVIPTPNAAEESGTAVAREKRYHV